MADQMDIKLQQAIESAPFSATGFASEVDQLFYFMLAACAVVTLLISALIVLFCIRYRRGRDVDRRIRSRYMGYLEDGWIALPLLSFIGFFLWGANIYLGLQQIPEDSLRIYGIGKQWMWKFYHSGGQREINELHIPAGRPVVVQLVAEDVIHSFFVPHFRIKQDAVPGRYTRIWFEVDEPGVYRLFCAEFCGTDHSRMRGAVHVLSAEAYGRWLDTQAQSRSLAAAGERLFRQFGCSGCHDRASAVHAPDLDNLFGRVVHLADGRSVRADLAYLRDSILLPEQDITAGYEPIMPSFSGQLSEEELLKLLNYIRSLGETAGPGSRDASDGAVR